MHLYDLLCLENASLLHDCRSTSQPNWHVVAPAPKCVDVTCSSTGQHMLAYDRDIRQQSGNLSDIADQDVSNPGLNCRLAESGEQVRCCVNTSQPRTCA